MNNRAFLHIFVIVSIISSSCNIGSLALLERSSGRTLINEVLFYPAGSQGDQWIELYNGSSNEQNLDEWILTNEDGSVIANLPAWKLPGDSYLVVKLADGENDADFSDGSGTVFTGFSATVLDSEQDGLALYNGAQNPDSIEDFLAWGPDESRILGEAGQHAISAEIWPEAASVAISFSLENAVLLPGESLGRSADSTDSDRPSDFRDHGGTDSFIASPGAKNSILAAIPEGLLTKKRPSTHANLMLAKLGFRVIDTLVTDEQINQGDNEIIATAKHSFTVRLENGEEIIFFGQSNASWRVDDSGKLSEEVVVVITPNGDDSLGSAITSHFAHTAERSSTGVVTSTLWSMQLEASQEPYFSLDQAQESSLFQDEYRTTATQTIKPGPGYGQASMDYQRTETIVRADRVSGQLYATISLDDQTNTLETQYEKHLFVDPGAFEFLYGYAPLIENAATYQTINLTQNGKAYSLAESPAYTFFSKVDSGSPDIERYVSDWDFNLVSSDGDSLAITLSGSSEVEGNSIRVNLLNAQNRVFELVIDPLIIDDTALAVAGIVIGLVGVGVSLYAWLSPDTLPPEVNYIILNQDCNPEFGSVRLRVFVTDSSDIRANTFGAEAPAQSVAQGVTVRAAGPLPSDSNEKLSWLVNIKNTNTKSVDVPLGIEVLDEGGRANKPKYTISVPGRCEDPPTPTVTTTPTITPTITPTPYPGAIGDLVWHDLNKDGWQNDNEPGIPNIKVFLYHKDEITRNLIAVDIRITDKGGRYKFENIKPGEYMLKFEAPPGFTFTEKNVGATAQILVDPFSERDSDAYPSGVFPDTHPFAGSSRVGSTDIFDTDTLGSFNWDAGLYTLDIVSDPPPRSSPTPEDTIPDTPVPTTIDDPPPPVTPEDKVPTITPTSEDKEVKYKYFIYVYIDLGDHGGFVAMPVVVEVTVKISGDQISVQGSHPWVNVSGTIAPNGSFNASGTGTVADFPDISVNYSGTISESSMSGEYSMGVQGGLPGGQAITYQITGTDLSINPEVAAFVAEFANAQRTANAAFLFNNLHPQILELYGSGACQSSVSGISDPNLKIQVLGVSELSTWQPQLDGQTLTIENVYTVDALFVDSGIRRDIHFGVLAGKLYWFTDCGDPLGQGNTSAPTIAPGTGAGATLFVENTAFCRAGPDAEYEEEWILEAGTESPIVGQYENGWILVKVDDAATRTECCWVGAGTVQGDAASIALITAIPPGGSCP